MKVTERERESESARGVETHLDNSSVAYWGHESLQPHVHNFLYVHPCHWLLLAPSMSTVSINVLPQFCHTHTPAACPNVQLCGLSSRSRLWTGTDPNKICHYFILHFLHAVRGTLGGQRIQCFRYFLKSFVKVIINIKAYTFSHVLCHILRYGCFNSAKQSRQGTTSTLFSLSI